IASGNPRQLQAIAAEMHKMLPSVGSKQVKIEGVAEGNWVLVDAGDVIVHLFRPEVREFYNLDQIYAETKSRK
ncbi:MAG: ribosome silencing factor, partial [Alphaproteobacteria bacterium]|nr:ribosome silencing factor [Alphaproteobacteria bacterium]